MKDLNQSRSSCLGHLFRQKLLTGLQDACCWSRFFSIAGALLLAAASVKADAVAGAAGLACALCGYKLHMRSSKA